MSRSLRAVSSTECVHYEHVHSAAYFLDRVSSSFFSPLLNERFPEQPVHLQQRQRRRGNLNQTNRVRQFVFQVVNNRQQENSSLYSPSVGRPRWEVTITLRLVSGPVRWSAEKHGYAHPGYFPVFYWYVQIRTDKYTFPARSRSVILITDMVNPLVDSKVLQTLLASYLKATVAIANACRAFG